MTPTDFSLNNPLGDITSLVDFINTILKDVVIPIGAVVVVFFVIYAGFLFVTAGGSEDKLKTAKKTLLWTVIGAAILLGSLAISTAIENTIQSITDDVAFSSSNSYTISREI